MEEKVYPKAMELSKIFTRIKRYGKFEDIDITDLTQEEQWEALDAFDKDGLKRTMWWLTRNLRPYAGASEYWRELPEVKSEYEEWLNE